MVIHQSFPAQVFLLCGICLARDTKTSACPDGISALALQQVAKVIVESLT